MDVYLVDPTTNIIVNYIAIVSVAEAQKVCPEFDCYERTVSNQYLDLGTEYHD